MSYTAGPWDIDSHSFTPQDGENMLIYRPNDYSGQVSTFRSIAEMRPYEGNLADARLIAAAPELLEAAQAVEKRFGHDGNPLADAMWGDSLDRLRAAIAKALQP